MMSIFKSKKKELQEKEQRSKDLQQERQEFLDSAVKLGYTILKPDFKGGFSFPDGEFIKVISENISYANPPYIEYYICKTRKVEKLYYGKLISSVVPFMLYFMEDKKRCYIREEEELESENYREVRIGSDISRRVDAWKVLDIKGK